MKERETEHRIVLAGVGGQGILFAGRALARAALALGQETTLIPSYGAEMRGGPSMCSVVIAARPIANPLVDRPTALLAMTRAAWREWGPLVAANGTAVVNAAPETAAELNPRPDVTLLCLPAVRLALAATGQAQPATLVALGALLGLTGILPAEAVAEAAAAGIKKAAAEANRQALTAGVAYLSSASRWPQPSTGRHASGEAR